MPHLRRGFSRLRWAIVRRAIDIREGENVDEAALKDLIRAAVALNLDLKAKSKTKPKPKPRRVSPRQAD